MEKDKKIAMIVASEDFRDAEYFIPREILEKQGVEVKTVSNKKGTARGTDGGEVGVDLLINELNPAYRQGRSADFDAVIFIGGTGALKYLDNETSYILAQSVVKEGKILGAICISPVILAKAGVLKDKKATVWSSELDKSPVKILEENGAIYVGQNVVIDGKIITANGPSAAEEFGEKIKELL